jgi:hypothetical protein
MPRLAPGRISPAWPRPGDAIKCHWWHGAHDHCEVAMLSTNNADSTLRIVKEQQPLAATNPNIPFRTRCLGLQHSSHDSRRWWRMTGSNRRPPACKAGALPAELIPRTTAFMLDAQNQVNSSRVVGLVGFEPTTPALSRRCSNRLSYRPHAAAQDPQPRLCHCCVFTADKCGRKNPKH